MYQHKNCIDLLSKYSSGHGSTAAERLKLLEDKNTFGRWLLDWCTNVSLIIPGINSHNQCACVCKCVCVCVYLRNKSPPPPLLIVPLTKAVNDSSEWLHGLTVGEGMEADGAFHFQKHTWFLFINLHATQQPVAFIRL